MAGTGAGISTHSHCRVKAITLLRLECAGWLPMPKANRPKMVCIHARAPGERVVWDERYRPIPHLVDTHVVNRAMSGITSAANLVACMPAWRRHSREGRMSGSLLGSSAHNYVASGAGVRFWRNHGEEADGREGR